MSSQSHALAKLLEEIGSDRYLCASAPDLRVPVPDGDEAIAVPAQERVVEAAGGAAVGIAAPVDGLHPLEIAA